MTGAQVKQRQHHPDCRCYVAPARMRYVREIDDMTDMAAFLASKNAGAAAGDYAKMRRWKAALKPGVLLMLAVAAVAAGVKFLVAGAQ